LPSTISPLRATYGEGAALIVVAVESVGVLFPGETMVRVAIDAGTTHHLLIPLVIAVATAAILGDNVGFWIGRAGGDRPLRRDGRSLPRGLESPTPACPRMSRDSA